MAYLRPYLFLIAGLAIAGCGRTVPLATGQTGTDSEASGVDSSEGDGTPMPSTTAPGPITTDGDDGPMPTTAPGDTSTSTSTSTSTVTTDTFTTDRPETTDTFTDDGPGTSTGPVDTTDSASSSSTGSDLLPDGAMCDSDFECASEHCFQVGLLGGICGECSSDVDCPQGGCTAPTVFSSPVEPSVCNSGQAGDGCETDAACDDPLVCEELWDIPGLLDVSTCSECNTNSQCGQFLCSPTQTVPDLGGQWNCVIPGSLPDGTTCELGNFGNQACASGNCDEVDIQGLATVGVCGECRMDFQCFPGDCIPGTYDADRDTFTPSFCR